MMPQLILDDYRKEHIDLLLTELKQCHGFNEKAWREKFMQFKTGQPRGTGELDAFIKFGNGFINPVLNNIQGHDHHQPLFVKLLMNIIASNSTPKRNFRQASRRASSG